MFQLLNVSRRCLFSVNISQIYLMHVAVCWVTFGHSYILQHVVIDVVLLVHFFKGNTIYFIVFVNVSLLSFLHATQTCSRIANANLYNFHIRISKATSSEYWFGVDCYVCMSIWLLRWPLSNAYYIQFLSFIYMWLI